MKLRSLRRKTFDMTRKEDRASWAEEEALAEQAYEDITDILPGKDAITKPYSAGAVTGIRIRLKPSCAKQSLRLLFPMGHRIILPQYTREAGSLYKRPVVCRMHQHFFLPLWAWRKPTCLPKKRRCGGSWS